MKNFTYYVPTKVHFGKGMISHLSELAESGERVLLVYGGGSIKRMGIYDEAMKILEEAGLTVFELSGVEPNPKVELVRKGIDLCLAVCNDPKRHGLYTPCAQSSLDLLPQKGADPVSHHTVQDTSRLLRVDHIHVDLPGMLQSFFHRRLRNLVKGNPERLLRIQIQCRDKMPADRFSLAVRVRCQIDFVRLLHFLAKSCQYISLTADRDVLWFIIILTF